MLELIRILGVMMNLRTRTINCSRAILVMHMRLKPITNVLHSFFHRPLLVNTACYWADLVHKVHSAAVSADTPPAATPGLPGLFADDYLDENCWKFAIRQLVNHWHLCPMPGGTAFQLPFAHAFFCVRCARCHSWLRSLASSA